eukprot:PhF_6_TR41587/c0_g1_i1/m.63018
MVPAWFQFIPNVDGPQHVDLFIPSTPKKQDLITIRKFHRDVTVVNSLHQCNVVLSNSFGVESSKPGAFVTIVPIPEEQKQKYRPGWHRIHRMFTMHAEDVWVYHPQYDLCSCISSPTTTSAITVPSTHLMLSNDAKGWLPERDWEARRQQQGGGGVRGGVPDPCSLVKTWENEMMKLRKWRKTDFETETEVFLEDLEVSGGKDSVRSEFWKGRIDMIYVGQLILCQSMQNRLKRSISLTLDG